MKSWGRFCAMMMIAGMIVLLGGCGGGGLGGNSKIDFGRFEGYAKINASAQKPMVGLIYSNTGAIWETESSSAMNRSSDGWQDVSFQNDLPVFNNNGGFAIVIFNDVNGDRKYDKTERLGGYQGYLKYDRQASAWQLWQLGARGDVLISNDMRTMKGRDLYIDCSPK